MSGNKQKHLFLLIFFFAIFHVFAKDSPQFLAPQSNFRSLATSVDQMGRRFLSYLEKSSIDFEAIRKETVVDEDSKYSYFDFVADKFIREYGIGMDRQQVQQFIMDLFNVVGITIGQEYRRLERPEDRDFDKPKVHQVREVVQGIINFKADSRNLDLAPSFKDALAKVKQMFQKISSREALDICSEVLFWHMQTGAIGQKISLKQSNIELNQSEAAVVGVSDLQFTSKGLSTGYFLDQATHIKSSMLKNGFRMAAFNSSNRNYFNENWRSGLDIKGIQEECNAEQVLSKNDEADLMIAETIGESADEITLSEMEALLSEEELSAPARITPVFNTRNPVDLGERKLLVALGNLQFLRIALFAQLKNELSFESFLKQEIKNLHSFFIQNSKGVNRQELPQRINETLRRNLNKSAAQILNEIKNTMELLQIDKAFEAQYFQLGKNQYRPFKDLLSTEPVFLVNFLRCADQSMLSNFLRYRANNVGKLDRDVQQSFGNIFSRNSLIGLRGMEASGRTFEKGKPVPYEWNALLQNAFQKGNKTPVSTAS